MNKDSPSFGFRIRIYTFKVSLWIVSKYSCNAILQGPLLEMKINIIEFDNLYFSKGSYSSNKKQGDVEMLRTESQLE